MVSVAEDELFPLLQVFIAAVEQAVFVHHQHAQTITGIEQFGGWRIVAATVSIRAEVFHTMYPVILKEIGKCASHSCMILVVIQAFDLYLFTVQQQSPGGIYPYGANAVARNSLVNYSSVTRNFGNHFVQIGIIE